ncbi:hypothetical protein ASF65_03605 [Aureimonas sp. Leaf324]|nr:hypothetical protein ASF65_03605 [Aureimonas sp. Leaf324]
MKAATHRSMMLEECMSKTLAAATLALLAMIGGARAEAWPTGTVTIIVPFAPGGNTDITGRHLARFLEQKTGKTFLVENRPGGGGAVGTMAAVAAKPDGQTLLLGSNGTFTVNQNLYAVPYDTLRDLSPVTQVTENTHVVFVPSSSEFTTIQQLFEAIRSRGEDVAFSSAGIGSGTHISTEFMVAKAGSKALHVPYPGAGPANIAVVSGEVDFGVDAIASALPLIQNGSVRPLAVQSASRDPMLPDVPTLSETVLPGFQTGGWLALLAPANTPRETIDTINRDLAEVIASPEAVTTFSQQGMKVSVPGPDELARRISAETREVKALIDEAGISVK